MTQDLNRKFLCISGYRRAMYLCFIDVSSLGALKYVRVKGILVSAGLQIFMDSMSTSICPVGTSLFSWFSGLAMTVPWIFKTLSRGRFWDGFRISDFCEGETFSFIDLLKNIDHFSNEMNFFSL